MLASLFIASTTLLLGGKAQGSVWKGDFTLTIKGSGNATGPGPSTGKWNILREAKGTIILDRTFQGAGIAGAPDSKNTARYETWISDYKRPIEMRMHDTVIVRGPLFAVNQIRLDTFHFDTPKVPKSSEWQAGKVGSPILQFDYQKGVFDIEAPRIFATTQTYFKREFVAGPKKWTDRKPILQDREELEFEIIHGLSQPREWFKWTGPFKKDQREIAFKGRFAFGPVLGASILNQKVYGELTLKLQKE